MRVKVFNLFIIITSLFILGELLFNKSVISSSIIYALHLWVNNLIPSLFPFFIISNILINYNITSYIPKIIKDFCKHIFNISDNLLTIFILSMISGFPSNARNTRILYDNKQISLEEANHILLFSHFANPVFVLSTIAVFFLHCERVGIIILISHYLSNFILGMLFRNKSKFNDSYNNKILNNNFANVFISSIRNAIDTVITICGIVTVFLMLSTIIVDLFDFSLYGTMLVKCLFEITIGIEELGNLNLPLLYKVIITSGFLSFGGLCVHVQVLSQIAETKIKYVYFFIGRVYQMIFSMIISYILCLVFKI